LHEQHDVPLNEEGRGRIWAGEAAEILESVSVVVIVVRLLHCFEAGIGHDTTKGSRTIRRRTHSIRERAAHDS
jgi:hypothetical protein